jgi:molecular chaperone GrpE
MSADTDDHDGKQSANRKDPAATDAADAAAAQWEGTLPDPTKPVDAPDDAAEVSPEETFAAFEEDAEKTADELSALRTQLQEAQDRTLRAQAELENVRKRAQREIVEERRYAATPLIRDLLVVADNVDRAIEAAEQTEQNGGLLEGFRMVADQLHHALEKHGCQKIAADGEPFDPHLHEAICQQPSAEHEPGTVMQVTLNGYQLHDRVVRPAQVIVSAAPHTEEAEDADDAGDP